MGRQRATLRHSGRIGDRPVVGQQRPPIQAAACWLASLNIGLFRNLQGIINLNTKIPNSTFQLGMSE